MLFESFQEEVTEALAIVDSNLWYVACLSGRSIGKYMVKSNSVVLQSSLDPNTSYNRAWQKVYYIAYLKESLGLSTNEGVSRVILDTNQVIHHIGVDFKPMYMVTTSSDSQMFYYNFDEVQTFAGGDERSSRDRTALYSRFSTPIAVSDSSNF